MEKVEAALTRAVRSQEIPDYSTFQTFMFERISAERDAVRNTVHATSVPTAMAATSLLTRYHTRVKSGSISPVDFRRYKLLRSFFADNGRGEEFANALMFGDMPDDLTLDDDDVKPAEQRLRLMVAISAGKFEDAHFLLGRLDEKDHDPGERAFFHALTASAAGNWDRVIAQVARVPRDAIDRPRAAWLAARAHAARGDVTGLSVLLEEIGAQLSACAWLHLIEFLGAAGVREEIEALYEHLPTPLLVGQNDPAWSEWATLHVRLLGQFFARDREIDEAGSAMDAAISDAAWADDAAARRGAVAALIENQLGGSLSPRAVASRLHPLIAGRDVRAFRTAVELLFEAGDHKGVVALARQFRSDARMPWERDLDVSALVHASATIVDDRLAKRIARLLTPEQLETSSNASRRLSIAMTLAPMARLSFLAAGAELDRIAVRNDQWRDCGLIALGLFRAIEIELNARLVRPLAQRLDIERLRNELPEEAKRLHAVLKLLRPACATAGLMLGQLRYLLEALAPEAKDAPTTSSVRNQLIGAFATLLAQPSAHSGARETFLRLIDNGAVQRFRNAPAHGEFVRLAEALAARNHAEGALEDLVSLLPRLEA